MVVVEGRITQLPIPQPLVGRERRQAETLTGRLWLEELLELRVLGLEPVELEEMVIR